MTMSHSIRRRLLIVTYYFPPCAAVASHRTLGFTRYLPDFGWDVSVVAPPEMRDEPLDPDLVNGLPVGTRVGRVPFPNSLPVRQLSRLLRYEVWLPRARRKALEIAGEYGADAVLTTSPPGSIHLVGAALKKRLGIPWIADMRDPWLSERLTLGSFLRSPGAFGAEYLSEKRTMVAADRVLANTPSARAKLLAGYPGMHAKIEVLTNGYDFTDSPRERPAKGTGLPITIAHIGEIYWGRDPRPLFRVMRNFRTIQAEPTPEVQLRLVGRWDGAGHDVPGTIAELDLTDRVELLAHLPHKQALETMREADILLLLQPVASNAIPAKLFEYLATGAPILAIANPKSDIAWILEASGVTHKVVSPDDGDGLERALRSMCRLVASGEAKAAAPEKLVAFSRKHLAGQLAERLDAFLPDRKRSLPAVDAHAH